MLIQQDPSDPESGPPAECDEHVRARGTATRSYLPVSILYIIPGLRAEFCVCVCYPRVSAASANQNVSKCVCAFPVME